MCVCNSNVCNTYSNKMTMSLSLLQFIIYKHNVTKTAFTQIVLFCLFVVVFFVLIKVNPHKKGLSLRAVCRAILRFLG